MTVNPNSFIDISQHWAINLTYILVILTVIILIVSFAIKNYTNFR